VSGNLAQNMAGWLDCLMVKANSPDGHSIAIKQFSSAHQTN